MIRVDLEYGSAVFTTREGGVSKPPYDSLNLGAYTGDDPSAVEENLTTVREELRLDRFHLLEQVHGGDVCEITAETSRYHPEEGDAMVTAEYDVGVLVTGADCPPLALATPERVAIVHCGWRSLAAGIVESTIEELGEGPILAAIGPGIGATSYEVGEEVPAAIGADAAAAYVAGYLDLEAVIVAKLERAEVEHIEQVGRCTFSEPGEFFSHRRDGGKTGRQAGIIWRS